MIEEWRPIVGYEGLYEVSSYGRVRSLDRYDSNNHFLKGRILKLCADKDGYLNVGLCLGNKVKKYKVHRLVAEAFLLNPDNLPQVNHRDEDKTNNRAENLEMCNAKYNSNYGSRKDRVRNSRIKNGTYTGLSREEWRKKYYQENKEHIKRYYQEKKDHIKEYYKKYYQEHKNEYNERQREYMKKYYQEHREKICEQQKEYRRKKKEQIQNNV